MRNKVSRIVTISCIAIGLCMPVYGIALAFQDTSAAENKSNESDIQIEFECVSCESQYSYRIEEPEVIEVVETEETVAEVEVDQEDLELLARLIYAEAGSTKCTDEMRYLVGAVALNRVKSQYFPNTLKEVVYQKGQYECVTNGHIYNTPTDKCYEIAKMLLTKGYDVPETVVFQSEFRQGSGIYCKIQNTYFCYR